ncbi:hypothetical protein CAAN1_07S00650 [[Candida] anglica]|uniref:Biogenesis of lysosome-related organelles complex 1 subunit 2 n=1 Tax=[Candida] anglica TaxID=148631 RepID=A0ABP0EAT5_9ASCO
MSYSRDTPRLIHNSLNLVSQIVESDTEVSVIDLNLLENLNTNQSLNYIKLEQSLVTLEKNAQIQENQKSILEGYTTKIDQLEDSIGKLEEVTGELDQWSKELELKVKNTN